MKTLFRWRTCFLLGLATFAVSQSFAFFVPGELAHPSAAAAVTRPILFFEFATTLDHLHTVFGSPEELGFAERLSGMIAGNWFDYLFMVVYGSFILSFFFASAAALGDRRWRIAGWLAVVAAFSDAAENALLQSISYDFAHPEFELGLLPFFVWTKFGLLALCSGLAAIALMQQKAWILAIPCFAAPVSIVPGMIDRWHWGQQATAAIALGLVAMLVWSGWRSFRPPPKGEPA